MFLTNVGTLRQGSTPECHGQLVCPCDGREDLVRFDVMRWRIRAALALIGEQPAEFRRTGISLHPVKCRQHEHIPQDVHDHRQARVKQGGAEAADADERGVVVPGSNI